MLAGRHCISRTLTTSRCAGPYTSSTPRSPAASAVPCCARSHPRQAHVQWCSRGRKERRPCCLPWPLTSSQQWRGNQQPSHYQTASPSSIRWSVSRHACYRADHRRGVWYSTSARCSYRPHSDREPRCWSRTVMNAYLPDPPPPLPPICAFSGFRGSTGIIGLVALVGDTVSAYSGGTYRFLFPP